MYRMRNLGEWSSCIILKISCIDDIIYANYGENSFGN